MEPFEGFVNCVHVFDFQQEKRLSKHYKFTLQSSKAVHGKFVSNICHKRERPVNQCHAPGSNNFSGTEHVQ